MVHLDHGGPVELGIETESRQDLVSQVLRGDEARRVRALGVVRDVYRPGIVFALGVLPLQGKRCALGRTGRCCHFINPPRCHSGQVAANGYFSAIPVKAQVSHGHGSRSRDLARGLSRPCPSPPLQPERRLAFRLRSCATASSIAIYADDPQPSVIITNGIKVSIIFDFTNDRRRAIYSRRRYKPFWRLQNHSAYRIEFSQCRVYRLKAFPSAIVGARIDSFEKLSSGEKASLNCSFPCLF